MESETRIQTLNKVLENGTRSFLEQASDEQYAVLNSLIREHHPETCKRVQLFDIRKTFFGMHPGACGMEPGVVSRRDGRMGLGYVRLSISVPLEEPEFDTSIVVGVLVDGNTAAQTVARISFDENTMHFKEIPYKEDMVDKLPVEFFTG